ncbi:MAG TPA: NAD-dependent succinate-semialdehyde dehydrogenase [Gemmatimonadaceae bacterium]|nr:NAD-dependent succinate-semialdehyde dehydrogenase [Gemmatimonadaceae bacterium]
MSPTTIATINPATGETVRTYTPYDEAEVERRLQRAADAFRRWRRVPVAERARLVGKLATLLEAEKERLGALMTLEMGKPIRAAVEEAAKCATACRYYAENAERLLAPRVVERGEAPGEVVHQPLGAVLAVMPWNFPFWQVVRFLAPALTAGNVGLLKHASNVPQCALEIEDLCRRAGYPDGVFQTLLVGSEAVARILDDDRVAAATLTGSEGAGRSIAAAAGKNLKKTVLELGGSDPFVVMPSADLEKAAQTAVVARTINNGQSCIAAKRFIVHERIADEFTRRFVEGMRALRVGDPMEPSTQLGPLASQRLADDLDRQVSETVKQGGKLLLGGKKLERPGAYYAATVIAEPPKGSPGHDEELFGPVAVLFRARDVDDAIAMANDSPFGLGAAAWTRDDAEARRFAEELEAGTVFINGMVASDPRFPFGGVKRSGYGRELAAEGLFEFTNTKTIRSGGGITLAE